MPRLLRRSSSASGPTAPGPRHRTPRPAVVRTAASSRETDRRVICHRLRERSTVDRFPGPSAGIRAECRRAQFDLVVSRPTVQPTEETSPTACPWRLREWRVGRGGTGWIQWVIVKCQLRRRKRRGPAEVNRPCLRPKSSSTRGGGRKGAQKVADSRPRWPTSHRDFS